MKILFILNIVFHFSFVFVQCYKILGVFPASSHSHFTLGFRLMKELADRGHEVAFINSHPQKEKIKNFRDISVEEISQKTVKFLKTLTDFGKSSYVGQLEWGNEYGKFLTETTFKNNNVQNLMNSDEKFDLVIMEILFNEAMVIFAHKFECPLIVLAPGPTTVFNNFMFANPAPSSFVSNLLTGYDSRMNFWERMDNMYKNLLAEFIIHYRYIPTQNAILQEVFPGSPDLSSMLYNSSLLLIISHTSLDDPVPMQQNIKQVGGYHVLPPKPLPKDIQECMDNATEGVVVFSMGSNLRSYNFEPDKRKAILKGFSKIKHKVLWKFEEDLPEKSDNVKILSWIPQSDVLAHPNTIAFISHGGLLGTTEAIYHGVPILGLPVFWDQERNIEAAARKGFAIKLSYHTMDEKSFEWALKELVNNTKYKETAKYRSSIMHDQPLKQLDEAIYWCEYVIRHNGAPHLRSAALDLHWYQLYQLDIILFIIVVFFITVFSVIFILRRLFKKIEYVKRDKKTN